MELLQILSASIEVLLVRIDRVVRRLLFVHKITK